MNETMMIRKEITIDVEWGGEGYECAVKDPKTHKEQVYDAWNEVICVLAPKKYDWKVESESIWHNRSYYLSAEIEDGETPEPIFVIRRKNVSKDGKTWREVRNPDLIVLSVEKYTHKQSIIIFEKVYTKDDGFEGMSGIAGEVLKAENINMGHYVELNTDPGRNCYAFN